MNAESKWSEVRADHIDESELHKGFACMHIDAWETSNDDEEGVTLAYINANKSVMGGKNIITISYKNINAVTDNYVGIVIKEAVEIMESYDFNHPSTEILLELGHLKESEELIRHIKTLSNKITEEYRLESDSVIHFNLKIEKKSQGEISHEQ